VEEKIINGKVYRLVTLRNRAKWIAKDGDAINPYRNQKVTIHYNRDGYPCFGGGVPVHLYVAHAWVEGYEDGLEVNHKDFNRKNFNAENLEWVTHAENIEYTQNYNYNTVCKSRAGQHNGRAIFSEQDIKKIRLLYAQGFTIMEIIKIYFPDKNFQERKKVWSRFSYAIKGKSWKNI
jgi:hypothetical protein